MRTSAAFFASVLALGALFPLACTQDFGIFDPGGTSTGTGGPGGGSSVTTSSSSTSSGTGGAAECMPGDACSDMNPCTTDSCDQGKCVNSPVPDGPTMAGTNMPNDCLAPACVGGALMQVPDDADLPDDGKLCTKDICTGGVPSHMNESASTSCGSGLFCNGSGTCVGCVNSNQCADPGTCQFAACENEECKTKNTMSGTSCGNGNICDGAGSCVECVDNGDCNGTEICIAKVCSTSCTTGVKDGTETDIDCGGLCMANCAVGKACKVGNDCQSGICTALKCVAAPTCFDTITNGTESDTDCGGSCALKCAVGDTCNNGADCASTICTGNVCVAPAPTCSDVAKNGAETDVDCGGPTCAPCGNTKMCVANTDCLSVSCVASACAPTQCSDGAKNGGETSVDCGGPTCTKCGLTKACTTDTDCLSNNCSGMVCKP